MRTSEHLLQIIQAGIHAARPDVLFPQILRWPLSAELNSWLQTKDRYLLCVGKAAISSAETILELIPCRDYFVIGPFSTVEKSGLKIYFASHPIPDERSFQAAQELLDWLRGLPQQANLLVVLSGGSSSLLASPWQGISRASKMKMNDLLIRCGATIQEINTVRKHLSAIKGGRLAGLVPKGQCLVLLISDVIGDDPATIGSGPFYPDPTTYSNAKEVLNRYHLWSEVPQDMAKVLERGITGKIPETPKPDDHPIPHQVVASNRTACQAARIKAQELGYRTEMIEAAVSGLVEEVSQRLAKLIRQTKPGTALILGGEVTIRVRGSGTGGRNQHLALLMTELLAGGDIVFGAAGSDGIDGNSPAAGAWTDGHTLERAARERVNLKKALEEYDSYHFFQQLGQSILTGPTGTNVMDLYIALHPELVEKKG